MIGKNNILISRHAFVSVASQDAPVAEGPPIQGLGVTPEDAIADLRERQKQFMKLHDLAQSSGEPVDLVKE